MKASFLDTGYLIALEATDDGQHTEAVRHWAALSKRLPPLVTTSHVFTEVVTFFNSRGHHAKAVELGQRLLTSPHLRMVHVDSALLRAGWDLLAGQHDKTYFLTDCVSFVVMRRMRIRTALAFDQAGFERLPSAIS